MSSSDGVRVTPLARRIAKLGDVDLTTLTGTGRRHRIEATDVIATLRGATVDKADFLLLHGLGSNAVSWSGLIASLEAQGAQVSALDLPGHGDNPEEASQIRSALEMYETRLKAVSFLRLSENGYKQAPYEPITKEKYLEMSAKVTPVQRIDTNEAGVGTKFCTNDTCEI